MSSVLAILSPRASTGFPAPPPPSPKKKKRKPPAPRYWSRQGYRSPNGGDTTRNEAQSAQNGGLEIHTDNVMDIDIVDEAAEAIEQVQVTQRKPVYEGPYSTVYKGVWNNQTVAVKVIRAAGTLSKTRRKLRRETQIWGLLRHSNVLPMYGLCLDEQFGEYGALVSPWCSYGTSSEYLRQLVDKPEERIRLAIEVANGMNYLHTYQPIIVHGDLKPANILIDQSGTARLCDFGLIRIIQEETNTGMTTTTPHTGTTRYLSQELMIAETPTPTLASDCYALGCVILEFAYLQLPYASHNTTWRIQNDISNGVPPSTRFTDIDDHEGHDLLWVLLEACWNLNPDFRPTSNIIYNHVLGHGDLMVEALGNLSP
ncbi:hypothetical protein FRC17_005486 [Serendipita sp. 399]|nr:hypothetical protein FRC17_005486 [Serendipita sp. 399]